MTPLLELKDVRKSFPSRRGIADALVGRPARVLQAVRGVSLTLERGETLGIVGESGCGKSTLGRCIAGLHAPTSGEILYEGRPAEELGDRLARARRIQMVFQDPYSSLNPRMSLGDTLDEVLQVHGLRATAAERRDRVDELITTVGLSPALKDRLPYAFSGGQRQRISIARALAVEPEVLVADEPVSALDASVQAQIINLFLDLRERLNLSYIFIAHDLGVVRTVSDRVAVMYLGKIAETAGTEELFERPRHPYTRALLSAIPEPDPERRTETVSLEGELPDPCRPPAGCSFSTRCPMVLPLCREVDPAAHSFAGGQTAYCHRAEELDQDQRSEQPERGLHEPSA
jgi:oligopeptide/dipeptide ABC transporter ATP-binding protein